MDRVRLIWDPRLVFMAGRQHPENPQETKDGSWSSKIPEMQ